MFGSPILYISFILPKEENEDEGLGHIWIDNLDIVSANGGSLDILNKGFDEGETSPRHWTPNARSRNPLMKWENEYPFSGGGDHLKSPYQIDLETIFQKNVESIEREKGRSTIF